MTSSAKPISPLRQRMIDDTTLRRLSEKTQRAYLRAVIDLTRFLRRSPDTATTEDLRHYPLHLVDSGTSNTTINANITAHGFFAVALVALDVRFHELWCNHLHRIASRLKLARPMMRTGTGFDLDLAARLNSFNDRCWPVLATQLSTQYGFVFPINSVHLVDVLCQINSDANNPHDRLLLTIDWLAVTPSLAPRCRVVGEEESIPLLSDFLSDQTRPQAAILPPNLRTTAS